MFISPENTFEINVYVDNRSDNTKITDFLPKEKDVKSEDITENKVIFRRPGYGDNVQILSSALKVVDGGLQLDPTLLRYERFCVLIKSWDFCDENGKIMEVNRENIGKLDPDIANFIIEKLEVKLEK
jgi:hypothetical protein